MNYTLKCTHCRKDYGKSYRKQTCASCGSILEVVYGSEAKKVKLGGCSFWDYEDQLPKSDYRHFVLGGTRMIRGREGENLFLKLEIDNPTRSFKDRGSIVEISKAVEYGYDEIVCASTGNMAYSLAHYAKLNGIRVRVFLSSGANADKVMDIRQEHDAVVVKVNGDFTKAQKLAEAYAGKKDVFLAGDYCYRKEGQKTITYEILSVMKDATHIIAPVGNATLISGIFKALLQLKMSGAIKKMPALVAVQSEGCKPLVKAFNGGMQIIYERPRTKADAIAVGFPTYGQQALEGLRRTGGIAISVNEKDIVAEQKHFYDTYGLIAEPAGVASIVAFRNMKHSESDKVVAIISGGNV